MELYFSSALRVVNLMKNRSQYDFSEAKSIYFKIEKTNKIMYYETVHVKFSIIFKNVFENSDHFIQRSPRRQHGGNLRP